MSNAKKTPLFETHEKYGGKIVDYAGWALPVQYEGLIPEHEAVRSEAGLFDVSHMGEVEIKGKDALAYVQNLITNDASVLEDHQILYTLMCYPDGGVVDDLLVYKFSETHFFLVINAGNIEKDYQWMLENQGNYEVEIVNVSDDIAEVALQGPKAEQILQKLTDTDLSKIPFFHCKRDVKIAGINCLISRTGYTGEDGFEVYTSNQEVEVLWDEIMAAGKEEGIKPAGLGSRDTLRFEATLPLYGHEISQDITPLEAGLSFFVKLDKEDFIGKQALVAQKEAGVPRKLVGFEMKDRGIPRSEYDVFYKGQKIGFVTTGYFSPTLKKNIGLALIDADYARIGNEIEIAIRKKMARAEIVKKNFYTKNYKK